MFDIIQVMTIYQIYTKLKNPPNLQKHMLRVTKVGLFIYDHWTGEPINNDLLLKAALLHDVGNIVKFNIEKYPHFLGEEQKRANYWIKAQKEIIEKYGTDDHKATREMLTELGVNPEVTQIVFDKSYPNGPKIAQSNNWILKILLYSDLRVSPTGVISIKERLDDLHSRLEKYKNREDLYEAGLQIEHQVQENMTIDVSNITDERIARGDTQLLSTEIETN